MENMKTKEVYKVIYKKDKTNQPIGNIYNGTNMKLMSRNYRIARNHSKAAVNRNDRDCSSSFCRSRTEMIYHLFIECLLPNKMRLDLQSYSDAIGKNNTNIGWKYIIYIEHMEDNIIV